MPMEKNQSKRPVPMGTVIFFIEKDGPSEAFMNFANFRKLSKPEAALIRREVLQQTENENTLYAAAFTAKGHGNERIRAGNRAVSRILDANALLEDARIHRTTAHEKIAIIGQNGEMTNETFVLNKGTTTGLNKQTAKAIDLFDNHLKDIAACLDIGLKPETKTIHKQIANCIHFFRKASEAEDHLIEFMLLICAVDGISGVGKIQRGRTKASIDRLVHLYKQNKRPKARSRLEAAFGKRGELFHANTLMDDVTLENESAHYITEISELRKVFLDALHAMLIQAKKFDTLNDAWVDFRRRSHAYKDENNDSSFIVMTSGKRIHAHFSAEAQELLNLIRINSSNAITHPSRGESP
jgi:hypothetical protein